MDIQSISEQETQAVGEALVRRLAPGTVVALYGDLGAGKTVLARGMARGLGITEPVVSPTFTIVQEYRTPGGLWFYHLDLYRIDGVDAALGFGIEEFLFAPDAIAAVEWPERIAPLLEAPLPGRTTPGLRECDGSPSAAGTEDDRVRTDGPFVPPVVDVQIEHVGPGRRRLRLSAGFAVEFEKGNRRQRQPGSTS